MFPTTQKNTKIFLAFEGFVFPFFSTDLENIFGSNAGNELGKLLRRKGPQDPVFAYDIVRLHFLKIYADLIKCNFVGDTKAALLRELGTPELVDKTWTVLYLITYTLDRSSKILFIVFSKTWETPVWKKTLCICGYYSNCFDVYKSFQFSFSTKRLRDGCFKTSRDSIL